MPEDTLNLPSDKKVGVNDNYALGICLALVLAIITPSPWAQCFRKHVRAK